MFKKFTLMVNLSIHLEQIHKFDEKTGFLKQDPNLFTSFLQDLKKGEEQRAHRKSELREKCNQISII